MNSSRVGPHGIVVHVADDAIAANAAVVFIDGRVVAVHRVAIVQRAPLIWGVLAGSAI